MHDDIAGTIAAFLESTTKFSYLNFYYQKQLTDTDDEEHVYNLETLYEWWEQEQREMYSDLSLQNLNVEEAFRKGWEL